jgi:hypothetical protein
MRVGPSRVRANRGKSRDGRYDTAYCNVRSLVFAFVATVSECHVYADQARTPREDMYRCRVRRASVALHS